MAGQSIQMMALSGHHFGAYVAVPAQKKGPVIVLTHEIIGVNEEMREK